MKRSIRNAVRCAAVVGFALAAAPATRESAVQLPGYGVSFAGPVGWARTAEKGYGDLARFVRVEQRSGTGALIVETTPAGGRDAAAFAALVAPKLGGTVTRLTPPLPDEAALIRLPAEPPFGAKSVVVRRVRGEALLVTVAARDEAEVDATARSFLATLKVADPTAAADDLALRRPSLPLFDSNVRFTLPEAFRPNKVDKPASEAFFGARDWPTMKDEASIQIQVMPTPEGTPLEPIVKAATAKLGEQFKLADPMTAAMAKADPETFVSSAFTTADAAEQRVVWTRLDDRRIALLIFRTTAAKAETRAKYIALADAVAGSLHAGRDGR